LNITVLTRVNYDRIAAAIQPPSTSPFSSTAAAAGFGLDSIIGAPASASTSTSAVRTWTAKNGQYNIKAKLLKVENGNAVLEKEDGKVITVPLD
jgi:hypothetical protein